MEYLRIENDFPRISHSAVTLGKFDGIHRGHQKLVEKIIEQKQEGAQAVVLALGTASRTILTKEERCRILEEMGVDILLECPLTEKIRHMKAENFIKEILIGDLQVSYVAVGEDFRFGYERKGTPAMLKEFGKKYGFHTEVLPKKWTDAVRLVVPLSGRTEQRKYGKIPFPYGNRFLSRRNR